MRVVDGELVVPDDAPTDLIRAAGGVVLQYLPGNRIEIACVYRESRGDWTFPKGKLDGDETFASCALREVEEETGLQCTIVRFVGTTSYIHRKGKPKIVAYYLMVTEGGEFHPNEEVTELRWVPLSEVRSKLTWERDQELFDLVASDPVLQHHVA